MTIEESARKFAKDAGCGIGLSREYAILLMANFAQQEAQAAVRAERMKIANELNEQILCSASTSPTIDLAHYIMRLRNGGGE